LHNCPSLFDVRKRPINRVIKLSSTHPTIHVYEYLTYKGIVYAFDIYVYAYAIDIGHFLAVKQNK